MLPLASAHMLQDYLAHPLSVCLQENKKHTTRNTHKNKHSARREVNSFFNSDINTAMSASESKVNNEKITYAAHALPSLKPQTR